jgi:hypothetical protein
MKKWLGEGAAPSLAEDLAVLLPEILTQEMLARSDGDQAKDTENDQLQRRLRDHQHLFAPLEERDALHMALCQRAGWSCS